MLVVLTLLFLAPFFEKLPEATLAAIVIAALWHSANPRKLAPVWKVTRPEFWLAVVVLVAVLALDTLPAIILGVIISLGILTYRLSFPQTSELGRDRATGSFESRTFHEDAEQIPGVVVYRFEAPLIYANAASFGDTARDLLDAADPPAGSLWSTARSCSGSTTPASRHSKASSRTYGSVTSRSGSHACTGRYWNGSARAECSRSSGRRTSPNASRTRLRTCPLDSRM